MSTDEPGAATAWAHPNVALVKYWGKRDADLNLPATGSISLTLAGLTTRTEARVSGSDASADTLELNGERADTSTLAKARRVLDAIRGRARSSRALHIESRNDFPTGAGLASSASGFAALAAAAARALGVELSARELSGIARLGSGSAARSVLGGFVEMHAGTAADGSDAVATPLLPADAWPLTVLVAVTTWQKKAVDSTSGMERTRETSPFWGAWVGSTNRDLEVMRAAVARRDLAAVGEIAEHSCLKMHALALAAQPPLVYWTPATIALIHAVRELRTRGVEAYFTIDAGPQVKVLCSPSSAGQVHAALASVDGVERILESGPGGGVEVRSGRP